MDNKKRLNIFCTKEEIDSIQLIRNKIDCASQACRPDAIPDGISITGNCQGLESSPATSQASCQMYIIVKREW